MTEANFFIFYFLKHPFSKGRILFNLWVWRSFCVFSFREKMAKKDSHSTSRAKVVALVRAFQNYSSLPKNLVHTVVLFSSTPLPIIKSSNANKPSSSGQFYRAFQKQGKQAHVFEECGESNSIKNGRFKSNFHLALFPIFVSCCASSKFKTEDHKQINKKVQI